MTCTDHPLPAPTAARSDDSTLFAALELSRKSWLVATNAPGGEKVSKRTIAAGDAARPARRAWGKRPTANRKASHGGGHQGGQRVLAAPPAGGIESHVVDPASIA